MNEPTPAKGTVVFTNECARSVSAAFEPEGSEVVLPRGEEIRLEIVASGDELHMRLSEQDGEVFVSFFAETDFQFEARCRGAVVGGYLNASPTRPLDSLTVSLAGDAPGLRLESDGAANAAGETLERRVFATAKSPTGRYAISLSTDANGWIVRVTAD